MDLKSVFGGWHLSTTPSQYWHRKNKPLPTLDAGASAFWKEFGRMPGRRGWRVVRVVIQESGEFWEEGGMEDCSQSVDIEFEVLVAASNN